MRAALLALAMAAIALPAVAANADQPYSNVDKSNDKGNATGNARVEDLNKGQLDANQPQKPGMPQPTRQQVTPPSK